MVDLAAYSSENEQGQHETRARSDTVNDRLREGILLIDIKYGCTQDGTVCCNKGKIDTQGAI